MKFILFGAGLFMIVATLLPFLRKESWWIRSFDFPRLQVSFITVSIIALYIFFYQDYSLVGIAFLGSLVLCLLYQFSLMYPYTPLAEKQVERTETSSSGTKISLLFANVQMDNRRANKLKRLISNADPDVILIVECDQWWINELESLKQNYPYTIEHPQDNCYGMALYSRYKLSGAQIKFLIEDHIPSIHGQIILPNGEVMELRCLHPRPPFITGDDSSSERDAELLIVGKEIKDIDRPTVVLGDLNDVAWSRTNYLFQDISGLLDPRIGRGLYNTFHARYPFIRFPLDHSFHTNHFKLIDFRRLSYFGSDHFPVFIELNYEPSASIEQDELKADEKEQQETEEKIDKEVN